MIKKTYEAPYMNEARTKLRTGLLAGSGQFGNNTGASDGPSDGPSTGGPVDDNSNMARKRSVSSVD